MKTKMWKKILSLALALVMAATLLPEPAWAAVAHDAPEWGEAISDAAGDLAVRVKRVFASNGPSPSTDSQVFLEIRNLDENNNMLATGLQLYPKDLVGGGAAADTELKGHATYDKSTNTLTLNNFKDNNKVLYTNKMGDDFKLNLVGDNELGAIEIWHGGYGGSLHITGEGTLTVNKNGDKSRGIWYYGISLQAEGASSQLTIENTATVAARGLNGAQAITVSNTNNANSISIGGNLNGAAVHPEQIVKTVNAGDIYTSYLLYVKDSGYYLVHLVRQPGKRRFHL